MQNVQTIKLADNDKRGSLDLTDAMRKAQKEYGISYGHLAKDIYKLSRKNLHLTPKEYFYYRLFLNDIGFEEKTQYIGKEMQRAIYLACNRLLNWDSAADKLQFYIRMQAEGFRVPENYAILEDRRRSFLCPHFNDKETFRSWFFSSMPVPVFCKPLNSKSGDGAFYIAAVDKQSATFLDAKGRRFDFDALWELAQSYLQKGGMVVQEAFDMHSSLIEAAGPHLATLRVVVCLMDSGPVITDVAWRVPSGENIVDNFAYTGNVFAGVDEQSGIVEKLFISAAIPEEISEHPTTGKPLTGIKLPLWNEMVDQVSKAALLFNDMLVQSWDVALTDKGVVFIEMNPSGIMDNCQLTKRRGVWQGDFVNFVRKAYERNVNSPILYSRKYVEKMLFGRKITK